MPVFEEQRHLVTVFPFKAYDVATDDFKRSTRMATPEFIKSVAGIIDGKGVKVDVESLEFEGLTAKGLAPVNA